MNKLPPLAFTLALGLAASPAFAASLFVFSSDDATQDSTHLGVLHAAGHTATLGQSAGTFTSATTIDTMTKPSHAILPLTVLLSTAMPSLEHYSSGQGSASATVTSGDPSSSASVA